jgi:hypothetical protein
MYASSSNYRATNSHYFTQMIAANPQMAPMAAQIRQTFSNPEFQAMV